MLKTVLAGALFAAGFAIAYAQEPPRKEEPKEPLKEQPKAKAAGLPAPVPPVLPAQPGLGGVQPGGFGAQPFNARVSPTVLARYEEEAEVLDAQLDVKKAYIKAAEVGVAGSKLKLERMVKLEASKAVPPEEVSQAKLELAAAAAQLDIRKAEAKEAEVRVKFAKKRLEDGKANVRIAPVRPMPVDPKRIDPMP